MAELRLVRFEVTPQGRAVVALGMTVNGNELHGLHEFDADLTRSIKWHMDQAIAAKSQWFANEAEALVEVTPERTVIVVDTVLPTPDRVREPATELDPTPEPVA